MTLARETYVAGLLLWWILLMLVLAPWYLLCGAGGELVREVAAMWDALGGR